MNPVEKKLRFPKEKEDLKDPEKFTMNDLSEFRNKYRRNAIVSETAFIITLLLGLGTGIVTKNLLNGIGATGIAGTIFQLLLGNPTVDPKVRLDAVEDEMVLRTTGEELPKRKNVFFKGGARRAAIKSALG
ncbi:MAG TPA: hypothetical protein VF189_01200 [Patescibacteria group bacterium]